VLVEFQIRIPHQIIYRNLQSIGRVMVTSIEGFTYPLQSLEFIPTAEGCLIPPQRAVNPQLNGSAAAPAVLKNTFYRHEYQINDHLGNFRIACRCGENQERQLQVTLMRQWLSRRTIMTHGD
jgi:hypothetical protein